MPGMLALCRPYKQDTKKDIYSSTICLACLHYADPINKIQKRTSQVAKRSNERKINNPNNHEYIHLLP